jgi:hypothetical protein
VAEQAVIGSPYTFQARFLDANNAPFAPTVGPTITIFSFSLAGAKNVLVAAAAMSAVTPAEVGRYIYVYAVPTAFSDGDMLYADIAGEDALANDLVESVTVVLIAATRSGVSNNAGLIAQFVEGG